MKINYSLGSNSPKSFQAYPRGGEFDLESGIIRKSRKNKGSRRFYPIEMIKSIGNRIKYYYKLHPLMLFLSSLSIAITVLVVLSLYESRYRMMSSYSKLGMESEPYPLPKLRNLVMVAGHSVYTSSSCEKADKEDAWFLEPYQKHPGQAATFVMHIQRGIEITAKDNDALLLFSGGETRKDAGPKSEAQSYWGVAESKSWFGKSINKFLSVVLIVLSGMLLSF